MSKTVDQDYLRTRQYRNATNLDARITLHARFSTNGYGWFPWLFDHFHLPAQARILELGCGIGRLWHENKERIPPGWDITLTDISEGMVREAQHTLHDSARPFSFAVVDAQAILYDDAAFDAIIANHMLYHVPDRPRALAEICRVLRPEGKLYASTLGRRHLQEINSLETSLRFQPTMGDDIDFTLENGRGQLAPFFAHVELYRYDDALVVTEAAPLVAFVLSTRLAADIAEQARASLTRNVEQQLAEHGAIHITKDGGLFVAWNG